MSSVLVALTALVAASVQATTGIGFALLLTPVLFSVLSPTGAVVLVTALGLALSLLVLLAERRRPIVVWRDVLPILAAVIPGSVCGVLILRALPKPVLQVTVGVIVLIAAALLRSGRIRIPAGGIWSRFAVGFTTGTLSTSTGISGPPLALWLSSRGLTPARVRDSLSAVFAGAGIIAAATLVPVLSSARIGTAMIVESLACVAAGHAIGSRVFRRLAADRFSALLLLVIAAAGTATIVLGATSL